jgi:photosystem II stability/assembly factor-like uncharacterized protein
MAHPSWQIFATGTPNTLIVVDVVNKKVVWAAGGGFNRAINDGTIVRTRDGGQTWRNITPPDGTTQAFRDVEAFNPKRAVVLASFTDNDGTDDTGPSRISRTVDGGDVWATVFTAAQDHFFDSMAFFNRRRGLAVSDPVMGKFPILATDNGGKTWDLVETIGTDANEGEGALATGTCIVAVGPDDAWFGTDFDPNLAPNTNARVFHTRDAGTTWTAATTPIPGTPSTALVNRGIRSLSFRDRMNGLAVGGSPPPEFGGNDVGVVARTSDGGDTWDLVGAPPGFRHGVAWIPGHRNKAVVVGPTGSDVSHDGGNTWTPIANSPFLLGIACISKKACWAVGPCGIAARLKI